MKLKHINQLELFHRGVLRDLQSLPQRTSSSAVYLLSGQLPLEAILDMRMATLLYMVGSDTSSILATVGLHQLAAKDGKSHSWFVYCAIRLTVYGLDCIDIIKNFISKHDIKKTIRTFWTQKLVSDAVTKSTLRYLHLTDQPFRKPHPVWLCIDCNPAETRKAVFKAQVLSGIFNQFTVDSTMFFMST